MPWIDACAADEIDEEDVIPWEYGGHSYALYRSSDDEYFCTDGLCTHQRAPLADGLVMGHVIECPKHNGQFDYRTGACVRPPARLPLRTYPVRREGDRIYVDLE